MSNSPPDEPFFSRWSRQKKQADGRKPVAAEPPSGEAEPEIDLATLPKVEDLTAESDVSMFLRKGVPEALQKLALRRMWSLDPQIRDFVEVAENQFDFHAPGGIPGLFQELAEGSDVSVWLSQATQSVVPQDPKAETSLAHSHQPPTDSENNAAAQHATAIPVEPTATETVRPITAVGVTPPPHPVSQEADGVEKPDAIVNSTGHQAAAPRRRHGGALPA